MTELEITLDGEKQKYHIPTSWDEVTVEQYMRLVGVDQKLEGLFLSIDMVSRVLNLDKEIIDEMDMTEFNTVTKQLDFLTKEFEDKEVDNVEIDGETYYMKKDFNNMTTGEVASIDMLITKADGNFYAVMDELLCVLLRKKVDGELEKFKSDFMERKSLFCKLPITNVNKVFFYFLSGAQESPILTKSSSPKQKVKGKEKKKSPQSSTSLKKEQK